MKFFSWFKNVLRVTGMLKNFRVQKLFDFAYFVFHFFKESPAVFFTLKLPSNIATNFCTFWLATLHLVYHFWWEWVISPCLGGDNKNLSEVLSGGTINVYFQFFGLIMHFSSNLNAINLNNFHNRGEIYRFVRNSTKFMEI